MRFFIFSIIVLSFLKVNGQIVFCPAGAEWRYSFWGNISGAILNEKIVYTGDTLVGNEVVKNIKHRFSFKYPNDSPHPNSYLKQNGDTVFMKNYYTQNAWQILYNFNVVAGDSWQNTLYGRTYIILVDSIDYTSVNGISLKRIFTKYTYNTGSGSFSYPVIITERFGSNEFLFNYAGGSTDGYFFQDFLCYKDSVFGQKQFTSKPCDFADYVGLNEENFSGYLTVYPNPVTSKLTVEFSNVQKIEVVVRNTMGQSIYGRKEVYPQEELDLSFLRTGVYYLTMKTNTYHKAIKMIKE